jgi:hypothetical protein
MGFDSTELRKFTDAGQAISRAANITFEQWAEGEAGQILKGWAGLIAARTPQQAELEGRNSTLRNLGLTKGEATINSGVRGNEGRVWIRAKNKKYMLAGTVAHNAGGFTPNNRHFTNDQWRDVQGAVTDYQSQSGVIALAKRTIGLARQSIVQIGDQIGIAIERVAGGGGGLSAGEIAQARGAIARDGKTYQNGFGTRTKNGDQFSIELINRYPLLHEAKIDIALATVVGTRLGLMDKLLGQKLAASNQLVSRQFPYLQTR